MPSFNTIHEHFKFNGVHYNFKALLTFAQELIKSQETYKKDIGNFLIIWLDNANTITLKTSGSTGSPKTIVMRKQAMVNSAIATGLYFNLQPTNKALLCLPAHYIAGKMMLIRAMVLGLEIDSIAPKSSLQIDTKTHYHFTAMVPMQLEKNLSKLNNIKTLIVGGAKTSSLLNTKLQALKTIVFETYGMTETVSHIAVKQINNFESVTLSNSTTLIINSVERSYFKTLPNVAISQDNRQCLIIEAPKVFEEKIITNDIVKIHSKNKFEWLGRADNIINSGGIKIFPEQVENSLSSKINARFFIASEKDEILGERVILIIESDEKMLESSVLASLNSFSKPKKTYYLPKFVETSSGKIQRKKTLLLLKN